MARVPTTTTEAEATEPAAAVAPEAEPEAATPPAAPAKRKRKSRARESDRPGSVQNPSNAVVGSDVGDKKWDELTPLSAAGLTVYRMSSLGGDLSQLVAGALGYEGQMPGYLLKYLQEGRDAEDSIVAMFNKQFAKRDATYPELAQLTKDGVLAGYDFDKNEETGTGGPQVWLRVGTTSLVRGHADRIVCINPKSEVHAFAVVEAKKFRPTLWNLWKANRKNLTIPFVGDPVLEKYAWQVSALHHATNLPVYFVVGQFNPETGVVEDIDVLLVSSTTLKGEETDTVPHTLAEIKARVMRAKKHVDAGEVPTCERHDDGCPYAAFDFCPGRPEKQGEDLDDVELGRLLGLYYAYTVDMSATEEQKEAEKLRKQVKEQIDKLTSDRGYARSKGEDAHVYRVWDDAGNEYEYEWVQFDIKARGATSGNKVNVKLVIDTEATAPEDHPE